MPLKLPGEAVGAKELLATFAIIMLYESVEVDLTTIEHKVPALL